MTILVLAGGRRLMSSRTARSARSGISVRQWKTPAQGRGDGEGNLARGAHYYRHRRSLSVNITRKRVLLSINVILDGAQRQIRDLGSPIVATTLKYGTRAMLRDSLWKLFYHDEATLCLYHV